MRCWNYKIRLLAEELKAILQAVVYMERIRQDELADACSVDQSTVHRWLSSTDYQMHIPIFVVPALTEPRWRVLVLELLKFQARPHGLKIVEDSR